MKHTLTLKVSSLVLVGVVTVVITSTGLTKMKRARADSPRQFAIPVAVAASVNAPGGNQPRMAAIDHPDTLATYGMDLKSDVRGNTVHLEAKAAIHDKREGKSFVWAVRFHPEGDESKVVYQKVYDDQIFTPGVQMVRPTFVDDIKVPLDPGNYLMSFGAYHVDLGQGVQALTFKPSERGPWFIWGIKLGP